MRNFILGFAACYLIIAVLCGFATKAAMPALNYLGVAYVGLVSPINIACTAFSDFTDGPEPACSLVPEGEWASVFFTFEETK